VDNRNITINNIKNVIILSTSSAVYAAEAKGTATDVLTKVFLTDATVLAGV